MNQLTLVKVGGGVLENKAEMKSFVDKFCQIQGPKVLVHGGGRLASNLMEQMGVPVKMVEGRRITDSQTLDIVTMTYGGLINKQTVAAIQAKGQLALGLTGVDAGIVIAQKRPVKEIDYGFVGDVKSVNITPLKLLIDAGITPVIAPLSTDGNGLILNTNADTIAAEIAIALASVYSVTLIYCFEKTGVLSDPNDETTVIPLISDNQYGKLKSDGIVTGGMIPKLDNCFAALSRGLSKVRITNTDNLITNKGTTLIA
ncbi:MAG: acetylglutamate kinase [Bacteroidales bacterium]